MTIRPSLGRNIIIGVLHQKTIKQY